MNSTKITALSRRNFLEKTALASTAAVIGMPAISTAANVLNEEKGLHISVFSKHLQFLNYQETAEAAAEIGFNGIDWAVRPKGHVLPENVEEDLPLAIEALKKVGMEPLLMTSGISSVEDKHTEKVLRKASEMGIKLYRMSYYRFDEAKSIPQDMKLIKQKVESLALLNSKLNIQGAFQNHAGSYVGASIWEIWELIKDTDPDFMGCQYDIRHATAEGGMSWPTGLRLIEPRINSIVLKDYKWSIVDGKWKLLNVPIGEGMVDFDAYFKLLKKYKINVPVSMHYEYDLGGAEHGDGKISIPPKTIFQTMRKDLDKVRALWKNA